MRRHRVPTTLILSLLAFVVQAAPTCTWPAAVRASQYPHLVLNSATPERGRPLVEPKFHIALRLRNLDIATADLVGYRDGENARLNDPNALFGDLCLLKFRDTETGKTVRMYDCPDGTKMVNVRPQCTVFSECQTFVCVPTDAAQ